VRQQCREHMASLLGQGADGYSLPGHLSQGPDGVDAKVSTKPMGGTSSRISRNGGGLQQVECLIKPPRSGARGTTRVSFHGRVPIMHDCMLSNPGLEAGSDKWCRLLSPHLDIRHGVIGFVPPVLMSTSLVESGPAYGGVVHVWWVCTLLNRGLQ